MIQQYNKQIINQLFSTKTSSETEVCGGKRERRQCTVFHIIYCIPNQGRISWKTKLLQTWTPAMTSSLCQVWWHEIWQQNRSNYSSTWISSISTIINPTIDSTSFGWCSHSSIVVTKNLSDFRWSHQDCVSTMRVSSITLILSTDLMLCRMFTTQAAWKEQQERRGERR